MAVMQRNQSHQITIEPARKSDLEAIIAIEERSYAYPWSRNLLLAEIEGKDFSHVYVARLHADASSAPRIIGYNYFWVVADEVHILNLAVDPDYRRSGYGMQLIRFALEFGQARGAGSAFLEVRASNLAAQQLYAALGFQRIGVRKHYYSGNQEDAYVLKKLLSV